MPSSQFKEELRKCANQWARESEVVKNAFHDKANYEENLRAEASRQPFKSKLHETDATPLGTAAFDAASQLCKKSLQRVFSARLVSTYKQFSDSDMWRQPGLSLASSDGCLRLDYIDLDARRSHIENVVQEAFHDEIAEHPFSFEDEGAAGFHHETCFDLLGHCHRKPHTALAKKFVKSFDAFLADGSFGLLS